MSKTYLKLKAPSRRHPHGSVEISGDFDRMNGKERRELLRAYAEAIQELRERNTAEIEDAPRVTTPRPEVVSRIIRRGKRSLA